MSYHTRTMSIENLNVSLAKYMEFQFQILMFKLCQQTVGKNQTGVQNVTKVRKYNKNMTLLQTHDCQLFRHQSLYLLHQITNCTKYYLPTYGLINVKPTVAFSFSINSIQYDDRDQGETSSSPKSSKSSDLTYIDFYLWKRYLLPLRKCLNTR